MYIINTHCQLKFFKLQLNKGMHPSHAKNLLAHIPVLGTEIGQTPLVNGGSLVAGVGSAARYIAVWIRLGGGGGPLRRGRPGSGGATGLTGAALSWR